LSASAVSLIFRGYFFPKYENRAMLFFVMGHSTDMVRAETIADGVRRDERPHKQN
jgi:hypothetical protein